MSKTIFLLLFSYGLMTTLSAQKYNTALGLRLGTEFGLTIQQRIARHSTLEAFVETKVREQAWQSSLFFEQHFSIIGKSTNAYLGAGAFQQWAKEEEQLKAGASGLGLITGFEFKLARWLFSYDFRPSFAWEDGTNDIEWQTGLSVRYIIAKRKNRFLKNIKQKIKT